MTEYLVAYTDSDDKRVLLPFPTFPEALKNVRALRAEHPFAYVLRREPGKQLVKVWP